MARSTSPSAREPNIHLSRTLADAHRSLDIFGGKGVVFEDLVREDKRAKEASI